MVCGMNLRTPLFASLAVVSALGGVAAAAIALPSSAPEPTASAVAPAATATPEVRTKTIRRTIHVVRREKASRSTSGGGCPNPSHGPLPHTSRTSGGRTPPRS